MALSKMLIIGSLVVLIVVSVVIGVVSSSSKSSASGSSAPTTGAPALVKVVSLEKYHNNDWMNLAEVKIYDESGNLIPSSKLTPVLSPSWNNNNDFPASNLVNNNMDDFAHTGPDTGPTAKPFSSLDQTVKQFMQIRIEPASKVSKIEIYNRKECCKDRINDIAVKTISQSNNVLSSVQLKGSNMVHTIKYNLSNGASSEYKSA